MADRYSLDRLDRRILEILQKDGRISNHQLSKEVSLSASACLARVKKLERTQVITGYRAQVDPSKLGPSFTVFAELTLLENNSKNLARIEQVLSEIPELTEAWEVSGRYDILARFLVSEITHWEKLVSILADSNLAIETVRSVVALRRIKLFGGVQTDFGQGVEGQS